MIRWEIIAGGRTDGHTEAITISPCMFFFLKMRGDNKMVFYQNHEYRKHVVVFYLNHEFRKHILLKSWIQKHYSHDRSIS